VNSGPENRIYDLSVRFDHAPLSDKRMFNSRVGGYIGTVQGRKIESGDLARQKVHMGTTIILRRSQVSPILAFQLIGKKSMFVFEKVRKYVVFKRPIFVLRDQLSY
jgi:hypothetical protein